MSGGVARVSTLRGIAWVAATYLALFGAAIFAWLQSVARQSLAASVVCGLPFLLALFVLLRHRGEPSQLIAKACACFLMPPAFLIFWSNEQVPPDARTWPALVAFGLGHLIAFVAFILWAAPRSTRVSAVGGSAIAASELRLRLASLADALGASVADAQGEHVALEYVHAGQAARCYRFVLTLDARTHTLYVRELESASGAAPRDASEADMRPLGSVGIDPTRPNAQLVWSKSSNATFLDPTRLSAIELRMDSTRAVLVSPLALEADAKHVAYAVAAVTTHSGWHYQPLLFDAQRSD